MLPWIEEKDYEFRTRLEPAERISVTQQPRIEPLAALPDEPRERKYDLDPEAEETIGDVASQNALDLERREELSDTFQDLEEDGGADFVSFGGSRGPASVFGDGPSGGGGGGQGRKKLSFDCLSVTLSKYFIYRV